MNDHDRWAGILDPGEKILWQGRPDGGFAIKSSKILTAIFGLIFAGFSAFWMVQASKAGGHFWMFGLLHFLVGSGLALHALLWPTFKRRKSWYTLTDRRAIIAVDMPPRGKSLTSYPITASSKLELIEGALCNVNFAEEIKMGKNRSHTVPIGFERLSDGRDVYRLMRKIQTQGKGTSA